MLKKLKLISIADMSARRREALQRKSLTPIKSTLGYDELMKDLEIPNVRELEDYIIECIYNGLLSGKLDQKNRMLHVNSTYGRDVKDEKQVMELLAKLQAWDKELEMTSNLIE